MAKERKVHKKRFSITDWKRRFKAANEEERAAMKRELITSTFNEIRDRHKAEASFVKSVSS